MILLRFARAGRAGGFDRRLGAELSEPHAARDRAAAAGRRLRSRRPRARARPRRRARPIGDRREPPGRRHRHRHRRRRQGRARRPHAAARRFREPGVLRGPVSQPAVRPEEGLRAARPRRGLCLHPGGAQRSAAGLAQGDRRFRARESRQADLRLRWQRHRTAHGGGAALAPRRRLASRTCPTRARRRSTRTSSRDASICSSTRRRPRAARSESGRGAADRRLAGGAASLSPGVPTVRETGVLDFEWRPGPATSCARPRRAPVLARLREAFAKMVASPEMAAALEKRGVRPLRISGPRRKPCSQAISTNGRG